MGKLFLSVISVVAFIVLVVFLIKDMKQSTELLRRRVVAEELVVMYLEQIVNNPQG